MSAAQRKAERQQLERVGYRFAMVRQFDDEERWLAIWRGMKIGPGQWREAAWMRGWSRCFAEFAFVLRTHP